MIYAWMGKGNLYREGDILIWGGPFILYQKYDINSSWRSHLAVYKLSSAANWLFSMAMFEWVFRILISQREVGQC